MLEVKNGELTGCILGEILDGHQKGVFHRRVTLKENILPEQFIAVGDGVNDLGILSRVSLRITGKCSRQSLSSQP